MLPGCFGYLLGVCYCLAFRMVNKAKFLPQINSVWEYPSNVLLSGGKKILLSRKNNRAPLLNKPHNLRYQKGAHYKTTVQTVQCQNIKKTEHLQRMLKKGFFLHAKWNCVRKLFELSQKRDATDAQQRCRGVKQKVDNPLWLSCSVLVTRWTTTLLKWQRYIKVYTSYFSIHISVTGGI